MQLPVNSNFYSRTRRLATIHNVTDGDIQTQHWHISATVLSRPTVG